MRYVYALLAVAFISCTDGGPTVSSSFNFPSATSTTVVSASQDNVPVPGVDDDIPASDVDLIGLDRKNVNVSTECGGSVTFEVPASGADYFNVWLPEVNNGDVYGPFEFQNGVASGTISLPPGDYDFQLAVERLTGNSQQPVIQDDRHRGSFTIVACATPPPPPQDECSRRELESQASQECEYGYELNLDQCYFECLPEPPPECENVWVVDKEAWEEVVTIVDQEAYDEEVCTPGEETVTGYVYKLTGGNDQDSRVYACQAEDGPDESGFDSDNYSGYDDVGAALESDCIPGQGAVDACSFVVFLGEDFNREVPFYIGNNDRVKFEYKPECNIVEEGEPVCETIHHDAVTHEETIEHPEEGHFEEVCEG